MIKARHHFVVYPLFQWLTRYLIRRNFDNIYWDIRFNDNGKSILIVANHISWWDGFWLEYLNLIKLNRKLHFMMLEEQLKRHWYFRYAGGFSIRKGSREVIESLNYVAELLKNPENMVIVFPQGKIHSLYTDHFLFENGTERILQTVDNQTQILLVANLIDYFSKPKPSLFIYAKGLTVEQIKTKGVQEEYNRFYHEVHNRHKTRTS